MSYIKELKLTYERKRVEGDLLSGSAESPEYVYQLFKDMENEVREKVVCLHLTDKYEIISFELVSIGTQSYAITDPVEILRGAILVRASKIILIHNHPFGNAEPSPEDIEAMNSLKEKAKVLDISLQDFLIVGQDGFVSLMARGLL